jgi:hypothetical protein
MTKNVVHHEPATNARQRKTYSGPQHTTTASRNPLPRHHFLSTRHRAPTTGSHPSTSPIYTPDPGLIHARKTPLISRSPSNPPSCPLAASFLARLDFPTAAAARPPDGHGGPSSWPCRWRRLRWPELLAALAEGVATARATGRTGGGGRGCPSSWSRQISFPGPPS